MTTTTEVELAHVVIGIDDENGRPYVYATDSPGDAEDDTDAFDAAVPKALVDQLLAARAESDRIAHEIAVAAGFDDHEGRMTTCCPSWVGVEHPAREWWEVVLAPSGDENVWPAGNRGVGLGHYETEAEALDMLDGLPDEFATAYGVPALQMVRKTELTVEQHGFGPTTYRCTRCGWDKADHAG